MRTRLLLRVSLRSVFADGLDALEQVGEVNAPVHGLRNLGFIVRGLLGRARMTGPTLRPLPPMLRLL